MRVGRFAPVVCMLLFLGGWPLAHPADEKNIVRFGIAYIAPTGDLTVDGFFVEDIDLNNRIEFSGDLVLEADAAVGVSFAYERRFGNLLGLEVSLLGTSHDVTGRMKGVARLIRNSDNAILDEVEVDESDTVGEIDVTPLLVGANFHVTSGRSVDLYMGPFVGYVMYGDLDIQGEKIDMDDNVAYGLVVGIDVPFGKGRWVFNGAARYMKTEAEPNESGPDAMALTVDPFVLQVGVGYRF